MGHKTENKQNEKINKTHRHRQQYGGYQRGRGVGEVKEGKGRQVHDMVVEGDLTWAASTQCSIQMVHPRIVHLKFI